MDTFKLKVFAIIVMLIDHIGATMISPDTNYWLYFAFRGIGRFAFPIFVFLIVEGFYHTRDIKKYLKRMAIFVLISEIPFDLAFYRYHVGRNSMTELKNMFSSTDNFAAALNKMDESQNVFFTLFLGLLLITLLDMIDKNFRLYYSSVIQRVNKRYNRKFKINDFQGILIRDSLECALIIVFCALAYILKTDYDISGILLFIAFYLFRGSNSLLAISIFVITGTLQSDFLNFVHTGNFYAVISILATLAVIPIALYNGEKGKSIKYFFYIFYPAHLLCLFLIEYYFLA